MGFFGMEHGFWFMPIIMVVLCFLLFRFGFGRGGFFRRQAPGESDEKRESPHEILKTRYAKGEITRDEYEEMKSRL